MDADATRSCLADAGGCPDGSSSTDDPRLAAALEEFARLRGRDTPAVRSDFLRRHPDLAPRLAECLDGLDFLDSAAPGLAASAPGPPHEVDSPPARLGDFRILGLLGRGGMGVVYDAEQVSLSRRVALKVLPAGAALDPRQRQRFQVEAQAAALLQHRHIVPVYAVGCEADVPYYAMQRIDGPTLADRIRALRAADQAASPEGADPGAETITAGSPGPPPPPCYAADSGTVAGGPKPGSSIGPRTRPEDRHREVARLGWQAAEALDHAHSFGVLHRDIKPSNLLLDSRGDLWMTDFGLARILDDPGPTASGDLIGTLRYVSPEQALGRRGLVDGRTDIYSLGATLYELATLRPAFDGRDRQELLKQILGSDPAPPRRLAPGLPRDLETIILKAMAKDPAARYPTARELADDLRRFLDDQPIRARRPRALERAARWSRRHGAVLAAAAVALALLLVGGGALLWRDAARTRAALAHEHAVTRSLLDLADALTFEGMGKFYEDARNRPLARGYARRARSFYETIAARDGSPDPGMRSLAARAWHRVAFIRRLLGDPDAAPAFRRSVAMLEALLRDDPANPELRLRLVEAIEQMTFMLGPDLPPEEIERAQRRSVEVLSALCDSRPENLDYLARLAKLQVSLASTLKARGRPEEAARRLDALLAEIAARGPRLDDSGPGRQRMVLDLGTMLARTFPALAGRTLEIGCSMGLDEAAVANNLAWSMVRTPGAPGYDPEAAVPLARRACAVRPESWEFRNTLGAALYRRGDYPGAREALESALKLNGGPDPHDGLFLAMTLWRLGDRPGARREFERALRWCEGRDDQELAAIRAEANRLLGDEEERAGASAGHPPRRESDRPAGWPDC